MALDQNLFTLNLNKPQGGDLIDTDLVDPAGTIYYKKRRAQDALFGVYDPTSESLLATVAAGSNSKIKVLQLYNPDIVIELKYVGTLSFKWAFKWEDHTFEWKREQCFLNRKPDPPVLVAITKEPPGRIRSTLVQIMDYNLMRFDVSDRKGLEIAILTSLLSFQEEEPQAPSTKQTPVAAPQEQQVGPQAKLETSRLADPSPPPPPPEKPQTAKEDQIAILQAKEARDANEVVVGEVGDVHDYAQNCINLLKDPSVLFISIRSIGSPMTVPKVVAVADLTKRIAHREELFEDDLHQYVSYNEKEDKSPVGKKKKVIKLDDDTAKKKEDKNGEYRPPENLTIRLSRIPMPELVPKAKPPPARTHATPPPSHHPPGKDNTPKSKTAAAKPTKPAQSPNNLAPPTLPTRPSSTPATSTSPPSKLSKLGRNQQKPQAANHIRHSSNTPPHPQHSIPPQIPVPPHSNNSPPTAPYGRPPGPPVPHGNPQTSTMTPPSLNHTQSQPLYPSWYPSGPSTPATPNQQTPQGTNVPSLTTLLGNAAIQMLGNLKNKR